MKGDVEAGEDALDHYIICVGGEMEERLPRSKDLRVQRREEEDRINLIDGNRSLKIALNAKIQHPLSERLLWPGQLETAGTLER